MWGGQRRLGAKQGTGATVRLCFGLTTWHGSGTNRSLLSEPRLCSQSSKPFIGTREENQYMAIAEALKARMLGYQRNEITEPSLRITLAWRETSRFAGGSSKCPA